MELTEIIDSRDLQERLEELEAEDTLEEEEQKEFETLRMLSDEVTDWQYGETFIREDYFEDYARELAEDIGAIPDDVSWPMTCIDWEQAADQLRQDYTEYKILDVSYLVRA